MSAIGFENSMRLSLRSTVEYTDIRDLGDRVIAIGHIRTRGRGSGVVTESPIAMVSDTRNGKSVRVRSYLDPREALEAAGLSE